MKHDEATLQTKTALAASLKKYMTQKPFKKITVSEIIADCNVNRKTFYYHFEDIYALLKWMLNQEAIEVIKNFDLLVDYEDAVSFVIRYVQENAHILSCAYDSMGRDELKRFFYNDFLALVRNVVDDTEERNGLSVTEDFKEFISDFLTEAIAGMLVKIFKSERTPERKKVVRDISVILESLPDILKRAPNKTDAQSASSFDN